MSLSPKHFPSAAAAAGTSGRRGTARLRWIGYAIAVSSPLLSAVERQDAARRARRFQQ